MQFMRRLNLPKRENYSIFGIIDVKMALNAENAREMFTQDFNLFFPNIQEYLTSKYGITAAHEAS